MKRSDSHTPAKNSKQFSLSIVSHCRSKYGCLTAVKLCAVLSLVAASLWLAEPSVAQSESPLSGVSFQKALAEQIGVSWTGRSLRECLYRLSEEAQVAIFLDRRVDPDQEVSLTSSDESIEDLINKLTAQLGLAYCVIDSVVYVGPPDKVDRLATHSIQLRELLRRMERAEREELLKRRSVDWEDFTTPQSILEHLMKDGPTSQLERQLTQQPIPYDLWAANHLPAIPWLDGMNIIFSGFDQTLELSPDDGSVQLATLPELTAYSKSYRPQRSISVESLQETIDQAGLAEETKRQAEISIRGRQISVTGSYLVHQQVARAISSLRKPAAVTGEKRYDLENTKASAGSIVKQLATVRGLELKVDADVQMDLQKQVELNVKNVTMEELLDKTLTPIGLTFEISGEQLRIKKK